MYVHIRQIFYVYSHVHSIMYTLHLMFEMYVHEPILVYSMLYTVVILLCSICPEIDTRCIKRTDTIFRDLADGRFQVTI